MLIRLVSTLIFFSVTITSSLAFAETLIEKGKAIMMEADKRDSGWQGSVSAMTMTLRNKYGKTQDRKLRVKNLEVENDGDKNLIIFDEPKDIKGSALLTFSHKNVPDDQWLYLPKIGRVKQIASQNKSGPFMGSEFAFEDLSSQEIEKFTYEFLKEDACGVEQLTCFVVKRFPVDKYSGYSFQKVWLDTTEYRVHKIEIFDRKQTPLKTFTATNFKQFEGKYWRGLTQKMVNHQNGKSTDLVWSEYQFDQSLQDSEFSKNGLKRAL